MRRRQLVGLAVVAVIVMLGLIWRHATPQGGRATIGNPGGRFATAMFWDGNANRVTMLGGATDAGTLDDTWNWDGAHWYRYAPAHRPPSRRGAAAAFDPTSTRR